ncbi:MAG: hypothetical protein ACTFAK_01730 [Candidatus Electronema sp. VV]
MKTTVLATYAMFTVLSAVSSFAATIIVDNNPNHAADHRTLQAAVDAATAGDTILIGPSFASTSYGDALIKKKLYIYGVGYLFDAGGSVSNNSSSIVDDIQFIGIKGSLAGSGSIVSGVRANSIYINEGESPSTLKDITIDRNYISYYVTISSYTGGNIMSNIVITRNIVQYSIAANNTNGTSLLRNNIIGSLSCSSGEIVADNNSVYMNSASSWYFSTSCSGEAYNNIMYEYNKEETSSFNIHNNYIATSVDVLQDAVYLWTGLEDEKYQLKSTSPAKGACLNGADCGAFAGLTPYILSGLPPRPRVTKVEMPATVLSTDASMTVKVSAEGRN